MNKNKIAIEYEDELEKLENKIKSYEKVLTYISDGNLSKELNIYKEFYDAFVAIDQLCDTIGPSKEDWLAAQKRFSNAEVLCANIRGRST